MLSLRVVQWLATASLVVVSVNAQQAEPRALSAEASAPPSYDWNTILAQASWRPSSRFTPPPYVTDEPTAERPIPTPAITSPPKDEEPVTATPVVSDSPAPSPANVLTPAPLPTNSTTVPPTTPPTPTPVKNSTTTTQPATPAPTKYVPPPIPETGTASLAKVPSPLCDDKVVDTIYTIYTKNRALFDLCAERSDYQIFPYSGVRPTPKQIINMATTNACTVLFTACVVSKLPECETSGLNLRAVTESLLKVTVDVQIGRAAPDTERFHHMHYWRRDTNLAKAAGLPYGNDSALYAEFAQQLPAALKKYSVQVLPDLTIVYNETAQNNYFFNITSGSLANVIAEVHPNTNVDGDTSSTNNNGTTNSSKGSDSRTPTPATSVKTMSGVSSVGWSAQALMLSVVALVLAGVE